MSVQVFCSIFNCCKSFCYREAQTKRCCVVPPEVFVGSIHRRPMFSLAPFHVTTKIPIVSVLDVTNLSCCWIDSFISYY